MTPIIDRAPRQMVGSLDDPAVLAENLPLGRHDDPFRIDPHADQPVATECALRPVSNAARAGEQIGWVV